MDSQITRAQKHFDHVSRQWDTLYSRQSRIRYLINKLLRKGLYERYNLVFKHCGDLNGMRILDIGCGTGRYCIECIKRGASKVVGIDFAPSMVDFSREVAKQMGIVSKCEFVCGDFLNYEFKDSFDIILALGFFDYIKEPAPIFGKIAQINPQRFVASFPKFTPVWGIQRMIRYHFFKRCPIYHYSQPKLERLYSQSQFAHYQIIPAERGFLGIAGSK